MLLSSTLVSASSPAAGHCSDPCHSHRGSCHGQCCYHSAPQWSQSCCQLCLGQACMQAGSTSCVSCWKHQGGPAAASAVKSSTQPQRGCAQQKLLKLTGYHLLHHYIVLNITECIKAQASPWWERKGFLQAVHPPLALVGLTCQERFKELKV